MSIWTTQQRTNGRPINLASMLSASIVTANFILIDWDREVGEAQVLNSGIIIWPLGAQAFSTELFAPTQMLVEFFPVILSQVSVENRGLISGFVKGQTIPLT